MTGPTCTACTGACPECTSPCDLYGHTWHHDRCAVCWERRNDDERNDR